jgi:hypothetical protein
MFHYQVINNTFVSLTEDGQAVMNNPRKIVQELDRALLWQEIEVDLEREMNEGNICEVEKQYLQFAHGL